MRGTHGVLFSNMNNSSSGYLNFSLGWSGYPYGHMTGRINIMVGIAITLNHLVILLVRVSLVCRCRRILEEFRPRGDSFGVSFGVAVWSNECARHVSRSNF